MLFLKTFVGDTQTWEPCLFFQIRLTSSQHSTLLYQLMRDIMRDATITNHLPFLLCMCEYSMVPFASAWKNGQVCEPLRCSEQFLWSALPALLEDKTYFWKALRLSVHEAKSRLDSWGIPVLIDVWQVLPVFCCHLFCVLLFYKY